MSQHDGNEATRKLVEAMTSKGFKWESLCFSRGQIDITMYLFVRDGHSGLGWKVHHISHAGTKTSHPTFMNPVAAATYAQAMFKAELEAERVVPILLFQALTTNR